MTWQNIVDTLQWTVILILNILVINLIRDRNK